MKLNSIKKRAQKGFTMIELVIVIAILGILAAFALPRFANFSTDAKTAAAKNMAGVYSAAIGVVKAKYIASGSIGNTVTLDGNIIAVTPTGDLKITSVSDCASLVASLVSYKTENGSSVSTYDSATTSCTVTSFSKEGWKINLTPTGATPV